MFKYIRIYILLLKMNLSALIIYRAHFYNSLLASIAWGSFSLYSIVLLTSRSSVVFGWQRNELLLLNGIYGIVIGCFHVIFSRNFDRFSTIIHYGQLDSYLLKPIDSQFLLTFWLFGYATISRVIIALLFTMHMINQMSLHITAGQLFAGMLLAVCGIILLYSIWFIVITLTMWFTRLSNLTELMFTITGTARYSSEMTRQLGYFIFFFFLPLTLIITVPVKVYVGRLETWEVIFLPLLAFGLFCISRIFWKFALRSYTSASS